MKSVAFVWETDGSRKSKIEINHHVMVRENQSVLAFRASGAL